MRCSDNYIFLEVQLNLAAGFVHNRAVENNQVLLFQWTQAQFGRETRLPKTKQLHVLVGQLDT